MKRRWEVLDDLIRRHGLDGVGVEVGVKEGRVSSYLLKSFDSLVMYGVDPYRKIADSGALGRETYEKWDFTRIIEQMRNNTARFGDRWRMFIVTSEVAADHFDDDSLDFVFIDAQHTYECVRQDIAFWLPKVRKGGIVSGHDYCYERPRFEGLRKAVDEMLGKVNVEDDTVFWVKL